MTVGLGLQSLPGRANEEHAKHLAYKAWATISLAGRAGICAVTLAAFTGLNDKERFAC